MQTNADQATPPFNSPYQRHPSRVDSLLDGSYPSQARHESVSKHANGLGLYNYALPPSPQPSEHWSGYVSSGGSPLPAEAIADPYSSGAFDYPVTRSPHWGPTQVSPAHISPRPPLSPPHREMPSFSHMGSEQSVKMETGEWSSEPRFGSYYAPMNVLPSSQLIVSNKLNDNSFHYNPPPYSAPPMNRIVVSTPMELEDRPYERASSKDSGSSSPSSSNFPQERPRSGTRRQTDPNNASFRCSKCPNKGFARRYNFKQHMLTHDSNRKKENVCPWPDCSKQFVRKTDLGRHERSVHIKDRSYKCSNCTSAFPRKDTLQRHEYDGCAQRNRVPVSDPRMLSQYRHQSQYSLGAQAKL